MYAKLWAMWQVWKGRENGRWVIAYLTANNPISLKLPKNHKLPVQHTITLLTVTTFSKFKIPILLQLIFRPGLVTPLDSLASSPLTPTLLFNFSNFSLISHVFPVFPFYRIGTNSKGFRIFSPYSQVTSRNKYMTF